MFPIKFSLFPGVWRRVFPPQILLQVCADSHFTFILPFHTVCGHIERICLFYFRLLQVTSRGQVVSAGTKTSSSFSLTPTLSWSPEACVTVYCVLSDGEVISDAAPVPISQHNYVLELGVFSVYSVILIVP